MSSEAPLIHLVEAEISLSLLAVAVDLRISFGPVTQLAGKGCQ